MPNRTPHPALPFPESARIDDDVKTVRVFVFAGQSNMVGSDSKAGDIRKFPPFAGLDRPQNNVWFSYVLGREEKRKSNGWVPLAPIDNVVGPELSFARTVARETGAPIAIIKCAAGGTTLGGDWNPENPTGFKLYPLALDLVRASLAELKRRGIPHRVEGVVWHQGENDMFDPAMRVRYGPNLRAFVDRWRRDLGVPDLRFQIGELCTKTIWGMDNRENMYAIRAGQKAVADTDPRIEYVPTSHHAVEIGGDAGLHYHYGTLGQLEHGEAHADCYLRSIGKSRVAARPLRPWPFPRGGKVTLFVLTGHRNMEGERAFAAELGRVRGAAALAKDNPRIAFRQSIGGGVKQSADWEPLGPAGLHGTFGPELSFGSTLARGFRGNIAIAKFTHSGSQTNDWTPQGTSAIDRNLYPSFIAFVRKAVEDLRAKGHTVEIAGVFHHVGENDMAFSPYRRNCAKWLAQWIAASRIDLAEPTLRWFLSQQPPAVGRGLEAIDPVADIAALAAADPAVIPLPHTDLPRQPEALVLDTAGVVALGERLARAALATIGNSR
ncbi:MAG: sialate O-acetylesterase [Armatimonadota bacterium]